MEDDEELYYLDSDFEDDVESSEKKPQEAQPTQKIEQVVQVATQLVPESLENGHNTNSLNKFSLPFESVKDLHKDENNIITKSYSSASNDAKNLSKNLFHDTTSDPELILGEDIESLPSVPEIYSLPQPIEVSSEQEQKRLAEDQIIDEIESYENEKLTSVAVTTNGILDEVRSRDSDDSAHVVKQQLQLLKKSSFRKQSSIKNGGSKSNSFSAKCDEGVEAVNMDVNECNVEIPEEDIPIAPQTQHYDREDSPPAMHCGYSFKPQKAVVTTRNPSLKSKYQQYQPYQQHISSQETPRTMKMGENNPANTTTSIRRRSNQQQQQHHQYQNRSRDSSVSSGNSKEYTSEEDNEDNKIIPEELFNDQSPPFHINENENNKLFSASVFNRNPFYASGHENPKPPVPRQDPNKVKAYRIKQMKLEKKICKKRKNLAWGKDPKYHYDEKTGLFTTFEIDARIAARKEETRARRQAYHYNPMAHIDEISDDEDHNDSHTDASRDKKQHMEEAKWKKKLIRKENPIILDREAAEREELRRRMEYISMQSYLNQQKGIKNSYQIFAVPKDFKGFSPPRTHKLGPPPRPPPPLVQPISQQDQDLMTGDATRMQPKPPAFLPQSHCNYQSHNPPPSIPNNKNNIIPPAGNSFSNKPFRPGRKIIDPTKSAATKGIENDKDYQPPKDGFAIYEKENPNNPLLLQQKHREEAQMRVQRMREYYRTVQRTLQQRERETKQQRRQKKEYRLLDKEQLELQKEEEELFREHNVRLSFRSEDKEIEKEVEKETIFAKESTVHTKIPKSKYTVSSEIVHHKTLGATKVENDVLSYGYNEEPSMMSHTVPSISSNDSEYIVPISYPAPSTIAIVSNKSIMNDTNEDSNNDYEVDWEDEDTPHRSVVEKEVGKELEEPTLIPLLNKEHNHSRDTLPAETVTTILSVEPVTWTEATVDIPSSFVTENDIAIPEGITKDSNEIVEYQKVNGEDEDDYGDEFDDITEENAIVSPLIVQQGIMQNDQEMDSVDDNYDLNLIDKENAEEDVNDDFLKKSPFFSESYAELNNLKGKIEGNELVRNVVEKEDYLKIIQNQNEKDEEKEENADETEEKEKLMLTGTVMMALKMNHILMMK